MYHIHELCSYRHDQHDFKEAIIRYYRKLTICKYLITSDEIEVVPRCDLCPSFITLCTLWNTSTRNFAYFLIHTDIVYTHIH